MNNKRAGKVKLSALVNGMLTTFIGFYSEQDDGELELCVRVSGHPTSTIRLAHSGFTGTDQEGLDNVPSVDFWQLAASLRKEGLLVNDSDLLSFSSGITTFTHQ